MTIPHHGNSDVVINECTNKLFEKDDDYFRQSCTSVVTAIIFAYNLGFKNSFTWWTLEEVNDEAENYDKKYIPKMRWSYETKNFNKSGEIIVLILLRCLVPFITKISELMRRNGVELYCSTKKSALSQYLNVDPKLI